MITYQFRIKDSNVKNWLIKKAGLVNHVWNLTQDFKLEYNKQNNKWLNYNELQKHIKNKSLHCHTVQHVIKQYVQKCIQFKKAKLKWRTARKNLGWIPITNKAIKFNIENGTFTFMKKKFTTWYSRKVVGKIMSASICQNTRNQWFVNIVCENDIKLEHGEREIGIDLGCKDQLVCSDGIKYSRNNLTKTFEQKLAMAQRANKKRLVKKIHQKIKDKRKDWNHKITTDICKTSKKIIVGDIGTKGLMKTKLAKSLSDASHSMIKTILSYKAIRHDIVFKIVSEKFSTITCSVCKEKSGPSGLSGLGVRQWECSNCNTSHDRDVNAAMNILLSDRGIYRQRESHLL